MDTLPFFRRTIEAAGLEEHVARYPATLFDVRIAGQDEFVDAEAPVAEQLIGDLLGIAPNDSRFAKIAETSQGEKKRPSSPMTTKDDEGLAYPKKAKLPGSLEESY